MTPAGAVPKPGLPPGALAWRVVSLLVACLPAVVAGCTNVVNAGTVVSAAQTVDAAGDHAAGDGIAPAADGAPTLDEICTATGGRIETRNCCSGAGDFSALCWNESCCSAGTPNAMNRATTLCACPVGQCFVRQPVPAGFHEGCNVETMMTGPDGGASSSQ